MKRRQFIKGASLSVVAVSTTGFIHLEGQSFVGDCQTTTDILGPFYRPNAPVRTDLRIEGMPGDEIILTGRILNDDCKRELQSAKVELWHCSAEEVYDNESDDYNYRGITYTDTLGEYRFRTQMPVPYDAGGGMYRPAHFHLMVSAPGYQNLVTQLYFTGDPYLEKDLSSKNERAKNRILEVTKNDNGVLSLNFDVVMQKQLDADDGVLDRLVGRYVADKKELEFFKHENQLWLKNDLFGKNLKYIGNNSFELPGTGSWGTLHINFELLADGRVKATKKDSYSTGKEKVLIAFKNAD